MCGRTACTLGPEEICKACSIRKADKDGKNLWRAAKWQDHPGGHSYSPSYNLAPSRYSPVLLRCVILCDGFYEWQTKKGDKNKQPYFIYSPQEVEGLEIWNRESWDLPEVWSEKTGWKGPKLLQIAGIFSKWTSSEGEEVYSFSMVTMESGTNFQWCHDRVPAILKDEQDVQNWLESGRVTWQKALKQLTNNVALTWHTVSRLVNNSRNQDPACIVPDNSEKNPVKETASSRLMSAWLEKGRLFPNLLNKDDMQQSANEELSAKKLKYSDD